MTTSENQMRKNQDRMWDPEHDLQQLANPRQPATRRQVKDALKPRRNRIPARERRRKQAERKAEADRIRGEVQQQTGQIPSQREVNRRRNGRFAPPLWP